MTSMVGNKYSATARESMNLPDSPKVTWIKGNTYTIIVDDLGGCVSLTSETVTTHYTKKAFEKFEDLFELIQI